MFRRWKFIFLLMISVLAAYGMWKITHERASSGVEAAREAFHSNDKNLQKKLMALNYTSLSHLR